MTIEEQIHASMSRWLSGEFKREVLVTSYDESLPSNEYACDTCGTDSIEVLVYYYEVESKTDDDLPPQSKVYFYYGSLGQLISQLT